METEERTKLHMDDIDKSKLNNFVDDIWKNKIIPFLNNISETNKIDKDYLKIRLKEKFQNKKIKLSKYFRLDQEVSNELQKMVPMIKNDMRSYLSVTVTIGDSDGD